MKSRCLNPNWPNYHHYGGRGITVCERWRGGFEAFFEDMGPRPGPGYSIERVNNDGDYTPENCRWATQQEQLRNTRQTMRLTWNGETLTTFEWAERTGIPAGTIRGRIVQGWSVEEALTLPARTWRPKGHRLTFDGETLTLQEWAQRSGLHPKTLYARVFKSDWTVAEALTTPAGPGGPIPRSSERTAE